MGQLTKILGSALYAGAGIAIKAGIEKLGTNAAESAGSGLLNAIGMLKQQWAAGAGQSLVSRSKALRAEPTVLIDDRCARLPYAKLLIQTAQRLYTPYYMLSAAADNRIGSVKVSQRLDRFAPDRDLYSASTRFLSVESFEHGLPFADQPIGMDRYLAYSSESSVPARVPVSTVSSSDINKIANDVQNLAVGQIVNLEIIDGDNRGTIPVQIRMRPMATSVTAMAEIIALGGEDNSRSARHKKWQMGDIRLWKDAVANQDRITRYRAAVMSDKSGYFRKIHERANRGRIATLLTGQPSIGAASSIAIMDIGTQRLAEEKMTGRFSDFETRQGIFDTGLMMMLMVVDDDNEVVTIYTRDIDEFVTYPLKDLESSKTSNDSSDLLKMLLEGRMPGRL